ncbi:acyltransferase family protein [Aspergillus ibericus CBS 121593]|uniref:Acyltransferase 3 domain-containing protein n=1 Tax=Aspergillus ibericus CBS 121593 TaxID=1448316 RepID=A0A395H4Q1_9EURO|nr:hypothetical protein BO80DRAFT_472044 [Aspergillus ibericus CBS 121593]RAL02630.1 hypothetical protein BO80DRAFT_472044 [Aspergillus ibericus CBS 121593]
MERIQWIDGLRGIAAFIVAFNHFFCGDLKTPFRSFWAEPAEGNRRIIQLPPFRLLWAMDAMVPVFMVISGYTIAHRLLQYRDNRPNLFIDRLRSSIFRRPIRIYLPVLTLATCTQLLFYFGLFESWYEERVAARIKPWESPVSHVVYLCEYVMDSLNLVQLQWNTNFNGHLWTMPLELRGSYVVYFTIFVQSIWRPLSRRWCLGLMLAYLVWYSQWDIFSFIAGLGLAELHTSRRHTAVETHWTVSYIIRSTRHWAQYDGWVDVRRVWHSIGAVAAFSVALESPHVQRLLASRIPQALGRLSFPIYLIHLSVYQIGIWPVRSRIWLLLEPRDYPSPEEEDQHMGALIRVFISGGTILGAVVMVLAELYMRFLEPQFATATRVIEMWLVQKRHRE